MLCGNGQMSFCVTAFMFSMEFHRKSKSLWNIEKEITEPERKEWRMLIILSCHKHDLPFFFCCRCDVIQGQLGDCYFLCALSVLAEFPERIKRLFVTKHPNEYGCYCLRLTKRFFVVVEWKFIKRIAQMSTGVKIIAHHSHPFFSSLLFFFL